MKMTTEQTPGTLKNGVCVTCGTHYPLMHILHDEIGEYVYKWEHRCNGYTITLCPWCREDSKPWTAGRGI